MSRILALIPARSGSKGVKDKNVRLLGGHPLIEWSIKAATNSKLIDRVIVSTDSDEYKEISLKLGAEVPFLRPSVISQDSSTDYEFILHALDWLLVRSEQPDFIVHLRPTTPFRSPQLLDQAIDFFRSSISYATALRSVHEMAESAYKTLEVAQSGYLKRLGSETTALDSANNPRQSLPKTFVANGYVDILSTTFIRKSCLLHGDHVLPFITPIVSEIDTEEDFNFLQYQLVRDSNFKSTLFS
jgi:N-acylneuraminate cytidylyltransferase